MTTHNFTTVRVEFQSMIGSVTFRVCKRPGCELVERVTS